MKLQIPFKDVYLVLDVKFIVIKEPVPKFISMQDMIVNGLEVSIQKHLITCGSRSQRLCLEKVFLIDRWTRKDMKFICFTEDQ